MQEAGRRSSGELGRMKNLDLWALPDFDALCGPGHLSPSSVSLGEEFSKRCREANKTSGCQTCSNPKPFRMGPSGQESWWFMDSEATPHLRKTK